MKTKAVFLMAMGVIILSVYNIAGHILNNTYNINGNSLETAYDINGEIIHPASNPVPVPTGNLIATETILLPDLYETGKGFTCTGLAYNNDTDTFLVGDIGALLPGGQNRSQIVMLSDDFSTVEGTIPLYNTFPQMSAIQGVTIDTSNGSIWFCSPDESKIRNITSAGVSLGSISITRPTGIAYNPNDDSLWVLLYDNTIYHVSKSGVVLSTYNFAYNETLDQCFLDKYRGLLYITAGTNYSGRNNVYCFDINTHEQSIACTVDSYSVEGIWLGDDDKMIILNDGYYHSAAVDKNQVNIYTIN